MLKIINIEDSPIKHVKISNVLNMCGLNEINIDWATNLEDGINMIKEQGETYDLIITDMWFPIRKGENDIEAGDLLIQKSIEENWNIPILLISTVPYVYPEILGTVRYGEDYFWEEELISIVKKCFRN